MKKKIENIIVTFMEDIKDTHKFFNFHLMIYFCLCSCLLVYRVKSAIYNLIGTAFITLLL